MENSKQKLTKQRKRKPLVAFAEPVMPYETLELSNTAGSKKLPINIILTGTSHKPESDMTSFEKMNMVKNGLDKKDLETLKQKASLDYDELAQILSVTRATLINKKGEEKFSTVLSERIIAISDIYSYGLEIFEDSDQLNQWMFQPNRALGGEMPFSLLHTQFGREEVRHILGRIAYGVHS